MQDRVIVGPIPIRASFQAKMVPARQALGMLALDTVRQMAIQFMSVLTTDPVRAEVRMPVLGTAAHADSCQRGNDRVSGRG